MAREKKSFFERLTGSLSLGTDDDFETESLPPEPPKTNKIWPEEEPEPEGELAIDLYQTPNDIVIQTMVAGVRPEDLQITITREMVTIKGGRQQTNSVPPDDYVARELYWGNFSRIINLPAEVETEEVEATERQGLLTIRLPKIDKDRTQKIKVRSI